MASFNKFNCFVLDVANGLHDMKTGTSHVYRIYLTNTPPVATNTVYNTPADLATANGYTAGGVSVGTITGAQTSGTRTRRHDSKRPAASRCHALPSQPESAVVLGMSCRPHPLHSAGQVCRTTRSISGKSNGR